MHHSQDIRVSMADFPLIVGYSSYRCSSPSKGLRFSPCAVTTFNVYGSMKVKLTDPRTDHSVLWYLRL